MASPYTFNNNPIDYQPPQQAAPQPKPAGPTNFWQRIAQTGVQDINKVTSVATGAAKEVYSTGRMVLATGTHNATAFRNANTAAEQNQGAFNTAKNFSKGVANATVVPIAHAANYFIKNDVIYPTQQLMAQATGNKQALANSWTRENQSLGLGKNGQNISKGAEELAGNAIVLGSLFTGPLESKVASTGKTLLSKIGNTGVKELADKVGLDTTKTAIGNVADQLAKVQIGKTTAKALINESSPVIKRALSNSVKSGLGFGTYNAANSMQQGASRNEVVSSAKSGFETGAALGAGATIVKPIVKSVASKIKGGAQSSLDSLKAKIGKGPKQIESSNNGMKDVMTPEQADKVAAVQHTQIPVKDESTTDKVGVKTPVRPGVKQVSETSKINVRTPVRITDAEYTKRFNAISKSYDQSTKRLQGLSSADQKFQQNAIDAKHQKMLDQLDNEYQNPKLSKQVAPKTLSKSVSRAERTSGSGLSTKTNKLSSEGENANKATNQTSGVKLGKPQSTNKLKAAKNGVQIAVTKTSEKVKTQAIEHGINEDLGPAKEHQVMNIKDQAQKATDLINTDPEKAKDIALGHKNAPSGTHPIAVFNAVKAKAIQEGDGELLRQLANSKVMDTATAGGQTLRILREGSNVNDPVTAMQSVEKAREDAYKTRNGKDIIQAVRAETGKIKEAMKPPTKNEWSSFIDSIKCG